MDRKALVSDLVAAMSEFEIIDSHEHLGPEQWRTGSSVDVFTLFSVYTHRDLLLAGMSQAEYELLHDRNVPLGRRWALFKPYWQRIRWGSYARCALLAAKEFYGFADITDETYAPLSEAMQAANTPGIYERVLRRACRIRTALTQVGVTKLGTPLLTPLVSMPFQFSLIKHYEMLRTWGEVARPPFPCDLEVRCLDDYLEAFRRYLAQARADGAVGLKMAANPYGAPDREAAEDAFRKLRDGVMSELPVANALRDYVVDRMVSLATEQGMVVAVHSGYWGDFRNVSPEHMIPIVQRHPDARFDLYHLGYPYTREALMLAKGFANVWLNFCWVHAISPRCATAMLDEAVDLLPSNKVLAFGGDYGHAVEKVYGHLVIARENVARVLAGRILEGQFDKPEAVELAHKWFFDNPVALYRLSV